jgi:hypothetical protein
METSEERILPSRFLPLTFPSAAKNIRIMRLVVYEQDTALLVPSTIFWPHS